MNKEKQNKIIQTLFGTKGKKNTQNYEEKPGGNQESLTGDFNCIIQASFFMLKRNAKKGDGGHYAIHFQLFLRNQLLNDNWLTKNITYYLIF